MPHRVHDVSAVEADILELAVIEFHQLIDVAANATPMIYLIELPLDGCNHSCPQAIGSITSAVSARFNE